MSKEIDILFTKWSRLDCKDNVELTLNGTLQKDENGNDFIQIDLDKVKDDNDCIFIKL